MNLEQRKKLLFIVKGLISVGLMSWLLSRQDWVLIQEQFQKISPAIIGLLLPVYFSTQLISAIRWHLTGRAVGLDESRWYYIRLYFLGLFFNLFLPTGMGGDVVKSYKLGARHKRQVAAAFSILIERGIGFLAMFIIGSFFSFFIESTIPFALIWSLRLIAICGLVGFILAPKIIKIAAKFLPKFDGLFEVITAFYRNKKQVLKIFSLSIIVQIISAAEVCIVMNALDLQVPIAFGVIAYVVSSVSILLPAINGIGVREAGLVGLFALANLPAESGIAVGLILFICQIPICLIGLYPLLSKELHVTKTEIKKLEKIDAN